MAKEICAVCGESVGSFRAVAMTVGKTSQTFCSDCAKKAQNMGEVELCRHVLSRSYAKNREDIQARLDFLDAAEKARPKCAHCVIPLKFKKKVSLDADAIRSGLFANVFDLIPAYCPGCFRMELFAPEMLQQSKYLAELYNQDT